MRYASLWLTRAVLANVVVCVSLSAAPAYALRIDGYSAANNNRLLRGEVTPNPSFDRAAYRRRNVIERCIGWLKHTRRIATRYDKTAVDFLAILKLA